MQLHPNHCTFLVEHGCVIVSIYSPLTDDELKYLCGCTAQMLARDKPRGAVLDLSGLDVIDSYSMQNLQRLCALFHLYSAAIVVAGINPGMAVAMALYGFSLADEVHATDLTDAITRLGELRHRGIRQKLAGSGLRARLHARRPRA